MAIPTVPGGFVSLILRCAILGVIPIALIHYCFLGKTNCQKLGALSTWPLFSALALAGLVWQAIVSLWVPEPYLDEIFHIPQAQQYCDGHWSAWDDKITTPPGLYLFSVAAHRFWWLLTAGCSPLTLRMTNWLTIITLAIVATQCRRLIEARLAERGNVPGTPEQHVSQRQTELTNYALQTGMNIAFFPLLFFFSGLYYTDVLSTLVILVAFWNTLVRMDIQTAHSWRSDFLVVLLGVLSLFMRQTNVFWVVIFMGGLEAVHASGALRPPPTRPGEFDCQTKIKYYLSKYSQGEIHDPPLDFASLDDVLYCALSIAIAVVCNPLRVMRQIWAHVLTMVLFAGFVFWNGGVVLGDKSNHVATIHLPQMLYIWPLFAFFSAPLLFLTALQAIENYFLCHTLPRTIFKFTVIKTPTLSKCLNILGYISFVPLALAIVKFNTIIHPFTLADNRHYMFYVFRYSILQASWVRYALVPVYTLSGILCLKTLGGAGSLPWAGPSTAHSQKKKSTAPTTTTTTTEGDSPPHLAAYPPPPFTRPPTLSTTLLFLLTTTLSLMTAPLVEPRYFILPWVFWRLLLPTWPHPAGPFGFLARESGGRLADVRVGFETAWFAVINLATMYIFITRPFQWASEEGLQRFMW